MKLNKTDSRYAGHSKFKFMASFKFSEATKFVEIRTWAWNQWGASCELDFLFSTDPPMNTKWAWMFDKANGRIRIYMATEKEYNWFILRWIP